jgi:hypothetical protein
MTKKLFLVETVSMFKHRYVIECDDLTHAYDEVTMIDSGNPSDLFESVDQEFMDETIFGGREISKKDFDSILKDVEQRKTGSFWMGEKLIRKIDYNR